jgi:hypothetical protein
MSIPRYRFAFELVITARLTLNPTRPVTKEVNKTDLSFGIEIISAHINKL